jgi:hypothetical protein
MRLVMTATLVVGLIVTLWGGVARAAVESELVQKGVAAYEALDFDGAVQALNEALGESLTREERIVTFRTLGFAYAALDRPDDARAAFTRLLRIDASAELDRSVAPKVRALFEEARTRLATGRAEEPTAGVRLPSLRPTLAPANPRAGQPLTFTVVHPGGMARSVHLYHRAPGEPSYSEVSAPPTGADRFELTVPGSAVRAPALEYYVTALDESNVALARAGTLADPLRVEVAAPPKKPVYKRGWFWGVLVGSAAVAAAVVAVAVVLTTSSPDPKAPADVTLIAPR